MNILEDLWFGNISPWERPFKKDSAYAELLAIVIRQQEDPLSRLNDDEKEIFEKIANCPRSMPRMSRMALYTSRALAMTRPSGRISSAILHFIETGEQLHGREGGRTDAGISYSLRRVDFFSEFGCGAAIGES